MVGEFLGVPADSDSELQAARRQHVERGNRLCQSKQVTLKRQGYSGTDGQGGSSARGQGQADEWIHHVSVAVGELAARGVGGEPRCRDVAVFAHEQRVISTVLKSSGEPVRPNV